MFNHCLSLKHRKRLMLKVTTSQRSADKRVTEYNHASKLTTGGRCVGDVIHKSPATGTLTYGQQNNVSVTPVNKHTQKQITVPSPDNRTFTIHQTLKR